MTKKNLQIHSENILPIIKRWLYSSRDIFVRELVSNACDALQKLKILKDQGKADLPGSDELKIEILLNKENKTITFKDNGIGMTQDEVDRYISQIAFSGAEDFVKQYEANQESEAIIGHFGLGFYSSYMVAKKVEINTLSYLPGSLGAFWECDGSSQYELKQSEKKDRGTEITLYLDEEHLEFLEETFFSEVLDRYCRFLPYAIYLDGKRTNEKEPLWIKSASSLSDSDYLDFFRYLYPFEEEPLFWLHLNVDYPFHLKGILYFPRFKRDSDLTKSHIALYCNRVFVADSCKDILPNYLMTLKGVIDSPDIPLNVSRSSLQIDRTVKQLGAHISKKVADSLIQLFKNKKDKFISAWDDISIMLKLGILEDDKFYDRVKEALIFKTLKNEWMTFDDYLSRYKETYKNKVFYLRGEEASSHLVDLYREKGIEVLISSSPLDLPLMQTLERKNSGIKFERVDALIHEDLIDRSREKSILDESGVSQSTKLSSLFKNFLGEDEKLEVVATSLAGDKLPGFLVMSEEERRLRDYMATFNNGAFEDKMDSLMQKRTFVINTNNPLVLTVDQLSEKEPELAKAIAKQIFELSLVSQKEMPPKQFNSFIENTTHLLESLSLKILKEEKAR